MPLTPPQVAYAEIGLGQVCQAGYRYALNLVAALECDGPVDGELDALDNGGVAGVQCDFGHLTHPTTIRTDSPRSFSRFCSKLSDRLSAALATQLLSPGAVPSMRSIWPIPPGLPKSGPRSRP